MIIDHRFTYSKLKELFLTAPFPEHFGVPCELVEKKHQRTACRRLKRLEVDFCAGALCYLRIGIASLIDVAVELDCWLRSHWRCWSNPLAPCHLVFELVVTKNYILLI